MKRYTDANALYDKIAKLEEQAVDQLSKLAKTSFQDMSDEEKYEFRKWATILNERTSFKFDIVDAPTADVVEVKHGKWLVIEDNKGLWSGGGHYECSACRSGFSFSGFFELDEQPYCPHCGAKMDGEIAKYGEKTHSEDKDNEEVH